MSPDPGECTAATITPAATMVSSNSPVSTTTISRSTSRRQRTVGSDGPPHPPDEPPDPGPSTSGLGTLNVTIQPPNPRRHRQRLATHYLNQIRAQQSGQSTSHRSSSMTLPFHHYYHPYHQHHHHHMHYPTYPHGFYTRAPTVPAGAQTRSRTRNTERSPFLMVKILLFSLMTIDFVMNTIGLAVIAVMAKNHYNNLAVEQSLHPPPPLDKTPPPPEDPFRNVYNHPYTGNEWTIIMPLLPSFIFVEILTLVGMFGVFCDLFSFTMTYAILKLITSLCYPSMASTAAVAAMATASTNPMNVGVGAITPGVPGTSPTNIAPSLLPLPLPENFTAFLNQAKFMSQNGSGFVNPVTDSVDTTTTIPPTSWAPWVPTTPMVSTTPMVPTESTTFISSPPPTTIVVPVTPQTSTINPSDTSKNYKHTRLKHDKLMAQMKQMKKTEKMAKLKQREKQLRSKLLRMESAESSPTNWTSAPSSHARISIIIPPGGNIDSANSSFSQQHHSNFKYHHRVWEALLCTFQVIFAVAFAFNTLTINARREVDDGEYSDEDEEGGERRPRRGRRYRSSQYQWPYSPLATSIDAFYFSQFQLPPPPPPYFGAAQSGQSPQSSPQRSASARTESSEQQSPTSRPVRSHRSLLDSHQWRRLTPSWLQTARSHSPPPQLSRSPSIRSMPPLYEEIDHDPIILSIEQHQLHPLPESSPTSSSPERIIMQMIAPEEPPPRTRRTRRSQTPMPPNRESTELTESSPPESPNMKTKTENITNIKIPGAEQPETAESSNPNKTLVIAINESDTRV